MKDFTVVDIQPSYHDYHNHVTEPLLHHINDTIDQYEHIFWYFNGEDLELDTINDMYDYIHQYEILDEDVLDKITFIDKYYAFFRGWMDMGVDRNLIVEIGKYMKNNNIEDSRDIDEDIFREILKTYYNSDDVDDEYMDMTVDPIHLPEFNDGAIRELNSTYTSGGGVDECLEEMEILFDIIGVNYKRLDKYTY